MCPRRFDASHDHTGEQTDSAGDANGTVVPMRRGTACAGVTVERIETEPMTADEYRLAVTALAVLINNWKHTKNPPEDEEKAA